jgi:hypothetical protein
MCVLMMRTVLALTIRLLSHCPGNDASGMRGSIYLIFEFMDHDLGGLLNRGVEFNVPELLCITKQLLSGQ